jgi:charged multivesicular body protein 2A
MSWLFGPRKTPADLLRENKRMLDKAIRELDRERTSLQAQEKKLIAEIKQMAKQNQLSAVRVMAKDLIRTRHSVTKFYSLKSQLQGVSLRMQTLKSTQAMADAMRCATLGAHFAGFSHTQDTCLRRGVTRAMAGMNKQLNLPVLQNIMREFERQNERMDTTTEVMGDAIDGAFEEDGEQEETDDLVNQVLDEIGCTLGSQLVDAPSARAAPVQASATRTAEAALAGGDGLDGDLQSRLDALRKS